MGRKFEMKSGAPTSLDTKMEKVVAPFELKAITDDGEDFFIVEGYASVFGLIDTYDDRIQKGAYIDTISNNPQGFPAFIMHDSYELPVGLFYELTEDAKGLFVKARLPKSDVTVSGRLVPQIKTGSVNALSIGFRPLEFRFDTEGDQQIRILEKIDLKEISFINIGMQADSEALLTDIKKNEKFSEKQNMINAMVDVYRKGGTDQVKSEINDFYDANGGPSPFLDNSVISTEELRNLSKSNLAYAIRELKISSNASNYLAGLVLTPESSKSTDPKGDEPENIEPDENSTSPEEEKNIDLAKKESEKAVAIGLDDLIKTLSPKIL